MIYLDNAATTLYKPRAVDEAVRRAMHAAAGYARGGYAAAARAGELVYGCREQAAALFGVRDPARVVFTMNATHALNLAIHALAKPGMRIAVGGYEHNAVMRPLTLRGIEPAVLDTPLWDAAGMERKAREALAAGTELFILNHVSNVFGFAAPLDGIAALLDAAGVPLILDASQSAGMVGIDVRRHPCLAAVCMPGHKGLYGPQGTGILLALDDRITAAPLMAGGTGSLSEEPRQPDFLPDALESGTPNVPGIAGLAAGIAFVRAVGPENILAHEQALRREFVRALEREERIECFSGAPQTGVLSLRVRGMPCETVAEELARRQVAVRAGLHCAPLAHRTAGTEETGTVRFSFSFYSTARTAEHAADLLCKTVKNL
ncbi:aminotransferase class V-fold PLP-dependent enzyme [Agathobaculum sp. NSJ-28]|uniref:Aminotransferase class V-fold PLP-dependent enzyme n=2 Tax=Agathobaculum TaxID=2048137 RepID=A0A923LX63_9FIRM|nr:MULTISPECIES: aminotransferase class V-fold PLP-dependent enzyme [Agathobaculum]MBC5725554.1 aminotransferase class V-fold PLP-dependent enzyme [Agathobaculum faecis]MCU6789308.1 aminotransferase class V-fold PLP-dependent enzyme [Agathobaculum ammoniilyticum]SCJ14901.1 Probable cysteine desulfurase [uncultured Butyricicoccus sp.]